MTKSIDQFQNCKRCKNDKRSYCKSCSKQLKIDFKNNNPIEHKIRQMAENVHKRLTTDIDNPRNKIYKEKGIKSLIGNNSGEIYRYLYDNFYNTIKEMIESGQRPSVDRINPDKHYEDGNIRIITFEENSRMGREASKIVCSKPIKISWDDGKVEEYVSVIDAGRKSGISRDILQNVLHGKVKHRKPFKVEYINKIL